MPAFVNFDELRAGRGHGHRPAAPVEQFAAQLALGLGSPPVMLPGSESAMTQASPVCQNIPVPGAAAAARGPARLRLTWPPSASPAGRHKRADPAA
ncbi:MAG: hypothetical protein WKG07_29270 [Hymenobacter sp.]